MIKCCIFDLDGTVLDTLASIKHFVNKTFQKFGVEGINEEECKAFVGNGAKNLIERALLSKGSFEPEFFEAVLCDYVKAYDENPTFLTDAYPGVRELLSKLKEKNVRLAVLSNKPDFAVKSLVKHFFNDTFDIVFGAREGAALKPNPDSALEILESLSLSASECAFIGDTGTDIETAKNMKARLSIGVCWGFRSKEELSAKGADVIAESCADIYRAVVSD